MLSEAIGGQRVSVFLSAGLEAEYSVKPDDYFSRARSEFVTTLPDDPEASILEIGCGNGATGKLALEMGKCKTYCGVELCKRVAEEARRGLTQVVVGNVESTPLPWRESNFDALILSEVLEHLVDPWVVLERLAQLVRAGGLVIASSPNVAQYGVILQLLRGVWDLTDSGVKDRTHLRWFTPSSYRAMFERAGFAVDTVAPVTPFSWRTRVISAATGGRLDHLFVRQIQIQGRKI